MSQALPIIGTGLQAATAMFDAKSQSNAYKAEAAVDKENARLDLLQGAVESEDIRRRGRAVQGEAIAALAEGGGDVSGMSARDLIYQNSLEIEYAKMNARYSAGQQARGELMKAEAARKAARNAMIGGFLRAGAAAISGASAMSNSAATRSAMFPGGQKLPMPSGFAQTYPSGTVPTSLPDYRRSY